MRRLDPASLAEIEAMEAIRASRLAKKNPLVFCPHQPTTKQRAFLGLNCLEALYGGAAGGGKSDALLMAALQQVHVASYSALILRRTYADLSLPGAIMDRAKQWLIPQGVPWNDKEKRFTFPSGATITFGYLDTDQDRYRYQGAELQFIGFDELTQFPENWYRYLLSRLRRVRVSDVPIRVRAASNPGGIGHDWVYRRFVDAAAPERVFVPATLEDNPHLDADEYREALAQLDPITKAQLLEGKWISDTSRLVYGHFDEQRNLADTVPELDYYLLGIDFGVTDDCAFTVLGWRNNDPTVYVVESYRLGDTIPSEAAKEVQKLEATYKFVRIVGDVGGMGKAFAEEARRRFAIPIEAAEKQNKRGYVDLFNGDLSRGRIQLRRDTTKDLQEEWLKLPWNEKRLKECDGFDNHASDSCLYGWRTCVAYHEKPEEKPVVVNSDEYFKKYEQDVQDRLEQRLSSRKKDWWEQ